MEQINVDPQAKKGNRIWMVLFFLAIPLFLMLGIFVAPYLQGKAADKVVESEAGKENLEQVQKQADSLYRSLQQELEFYKSQTDSLYPEISEKEDELEKQYIRMQNLISQAKQDKSSGIEIESKMKELREELGRMRKYVDDQTLDVAEMRRQNAQLLGEKQELSRKYEKELSEKERLEKEYKLLNEIKAEMSEKVDKASVLQITNIKIVGAKLSTKGEDREQNVAKKTEFIKICFDVVRNEVVRPGINKFYVLITDPTGWPIVVESRGSGKIELSGGKERKEEFYTMMKSFNYNTDLKEFCLSWSQVPGKPFEKGVYHIEIFNQGYSVGKTTLSLK